MSDKKNIDRLFQEKLKDFEATPNDAVWENIQERLHKDKRKRRVLIPIWWKYAGVAAFLVLLFTVGNLVFNTSEDANPNNTVVDTKENNNLNEKASDLNSKGDNNLNKLNSEDNTENNSTVAKEDTTEEISDKKSQTNTSQIDNELLNISKNKTKKSNTAVTQSNSNNKNRSDSKNYLPSNQLNKKIDSQSKEALANTNKTPNLPEPNINNKSKSELDSSINTSKTENAIVKTPTSETENLKEEEKVSEKEKDITIENAIVKADNTNEKEKEEEKLNRWSISPNVAPVYFNTLGKGSAISNQFVNNTKDGEVNMSYGVGGTYAINKKLKIRAGINKLDLGYSTKDVIAYNGINARSSQGNIKFKDSSMTFLSTQSLSFASVPEIVNTNIKGSIDQRFGFIEVPLEVEYALVDKKIGVNVIGGFSSMFLTKNEVYSVLEGDRSLIGEATNINKTSYSANFGIGVNYNISEKVKVNLEPMFKYQINTFTDSSGDFKPYFIGVYTGLSYKF